jgi:hypothetical protein
MDPIFHAIIPLRSTTNTWTVYSCGSLYFIIKNVFDCWKPKRKKTKKRFWIKTTNFFRWPNSSTTFTTTKTSSRWIMFIKIRKYTWSSPKKRINWMYQPLLSRKYRYQLNSKYKWKYGFVFLPFSFSIKIYFQKEHSRSIIILNIISM